MARGYKSELPVDRICKFIEDSGLSFKKSEVSFIFDCPRCMKRDKLYISRRHGYFVCWYCSEIEGFQGRPEYALSELLLTPVGKIRAAIYGEKHYESKPFLAVDLVDFFGGSDIIDSDADAIPTIAVPLDYYPLDHKYAEAGRKYLEGRGIPQPVASYYGVRYSPVRQRVMFPIEMGGRLVGFQERLTVASRYLSEDGSKVIEAPKVLSSKGIPRNHVVMFEKRLQGNKHVVLCEGPVDCLKAHACRGNVATMGKAVTQGQIQLLRNNGIEKVYLAIDPDAAQETARLVREFADLEVRLMHPPKGKKDLGEMTFSEVYRLFLDAPLVNPGKIFIFMNSDKVILKQRV